MLDADLLQREYNRYREYYNVMLQWVRLKNINKRVDDYLIKNEIKKVAIYGMSDIGYCLYEEIIQKNICKVLYTIDQGTPKLYYDIPCFKLEDIKNKESVDCIIVTLPHIYEKIKKNIKEIVDYRTMSITELIYNSYYDISME